MSPRVVSVRVVAPLVLRVAFEGGEERDFDAGRYVEPATVFAPLADPEAFARVEVVNRGGGVAWACGADLSRDTLYLAGVPVRAAA